MKKKIIIEVLEKERIDVVKPLWEALNEHHKAQSVHFKKRFQQFSFEMASQIKDSVYLQIPNAGHAAFYEKQKAFLTAVKGFLSINK